MAAGHMIESTLFDKDFIIAFFFFSKILEFMKTAEIPLTEQVFAALITAYGFNG